jgi:hypothetical protein
MTEFKANEVFASPMPYGITWLLMPLKVLQNSLRPIRIFIPKSQGEKGDNNHNVVNTEIITKLKQGRFW